MSTPTRPLNAGKARKRLRAIVEEAREQLDRRLAELAAALPRAKHRDAMFAGEIPFNVTTAMWAAIDHTRENELALALERLEEASRVSVSELDDRFACQQAAERDSGSSTEATEAARAAAPPPTPPTVDDLAQLLLAIDEHPVPRIAGVLRWLIRSEPSARRLLRRLEGLAADAAAPGDPGVFRRPGWALTALGVKRALDHLIMQGGWTDPAAELDPAGDHELDLASVLRACEARLERLGSSAPRVSLVRDELRTCLARRRRARERLGLASESADARLATLERQLSVLGRRFDNALTAPSADIAGDGPAA